VNELIGCSMRPPRTECLIRELHERRLVVRRLGHPIQLRLLPPLLRRLQIPCPLTQNPRQMQRLFHFDWERCRTIARIPGHNPLDSLLNALS
jgi:hypothetical protein